MARPARLSNRDHRNEGANPNAQATRRRSGRVDSQSLSPSPATSFSSDKENRQASSRTPRQGKNTSKAMEPLQMPTPEIEASRTNKRRRLSERKAATATQTTYQKQLADAADTDFYDPEQNMHERRAVRKDFRDLSRELTDSRAEYLAQGSKGLFNTLTKANELFSSVKQTSDATLDSRLLVSTADLSAKRTTQLTLGDSTTGIDIDDFVGKCITFMRRAPPDATSLGRQRQDDSEEENVEGFDEGDAFNWEWLGRQACFPNNVRPPVPSFLLGPLSVQRKMRKATQRRERLQKRNPNDAIRPEEMKAQDFEKSDNSNLTTICTKIKELLVKIMVDGQQAVYREMADQASDDEVRALMAKHNIADDEGVPFFHFVMNPKSFGQTVENIFYISFLVKDGEVGFGNDSTSMPTLHATTARSPEEIKELNISKHQAVFHLDFETWEDIIQTFGIANSIIPHRQTEEEVQIGASGWYG